MPSDTYSLIRRAILTKQNVSAAYDGHFRDLSPHMLGTKDGKEQALFFQFAGGSSRGDLPDWRCLTLDQLSNVSAIEGQWQTRSDYSPDTDPCVDKFDVKA